MAKAPYYIIYKKQGAKTLSRATHGWDNTDPDMAGIFYAEGPAFLSKKKIPAFEKR